jgi:hypothetical protein
VWWVSREEYSGTCLIRHTQVHGKCVGLYRMSKYSGFILVLQSRCSTNGVTGGHVSFWDFQFCLHKSGVFLVIWLSVKRNKHVMCTLIFTNHINTVELVQSDTWVSDIQQKNRRSVRLHSGITFMRKFALSSC